MSVCTYYVGISHLTGEKKIEKTILLVLTTNFVEIILIRIWEAQKKKKQEEQRNCCCWWIVRPIGLKVTTSRMPATIFKASISFVYYIKLYFKYNVYYRKINEDSWKLLYGNVVGNRLFDLAVKFHWDLLHFEEEKRFCDISSATVRESSTVYPGERLLLIYGRPVASGKHKGDLVRHCFSYYGKKRNGSINPFVTAENVPDRGHFIFRQKTPFFSI